MDSVIDQRVFHKIYGEGTVIKHVPGYVTVRFAAKDATFLYPDAFRSFLKLADPQLQEAVERESDRQEPPAEEPVSTAPVSAPGAGREYIEIRQIIATLQRLRPDYRRDIAHIGQAAATLAAGGTLGLRVHVRELVLSLLSSIRPWSGIENNLPALSHVFCDYDPDRLLEKDEEVLLGEVLQLKCGNLTIRKQLRSLKDNIRILQRIDRKPGGIDRYYADTDKYTLVEQLSSPDSPYKLKSMGIRLVCEYLKGVGIDVVKPDRHVARIVGRLGYSQKCPAGDMETLRICDDIARTLGISNAEVDTVLWQYCAENRCNICGAEPDCGRCGVVNCPGRR